MLILDAQKTFARANGKPLSSVARAGLSFERKVFEELKKSLPAKGFLIERNPWFRYRAPDGTDKFCSPDIMITDLEDCYIAIGEVKLSWVPGAIEKLKSLYCPVVARALKMPTKPLVIAKNSGPGAPNANTRFGFALMAENPFLLWRGDSPIPL